MFSKLRGRLTYTNVLLTLVLVFAMTGGAYAAGKYAITSTKQISPKVLKTLTGKTGSAGKEGPVGKEGVPGKEGPAGKDGAPGKEGPAGKDGTPGPHGEPGLTGPQGPTGPAGKEGAAGKNGTTGFTKTLPSGETETGTWSATIATVESEKANVVSPISFPIPLKLALTATQVHYVPDCENSEGTKLAECEAAVKVVEKECPGSAELPKAAAGGNLCVYEGFVREPEAEGSQLPSVHFGEATRKGVTGGFGAGSYGAIMTISYEGPAPEPSSPILMLGSWAVTAP